MDINKIKTFVVAANSSSYYDAADKLFTSAQTVSKHIHTLELEWDMPLFERLPRGVRLTAFGRAALPRARKILEEYEEIIKIPAGPEATSLRIYSIPNQSDFRIGDFLAEFAQERSDITISLKDCHGGYIIKALEGGECELAIGGLSFLNLRRVEVSSIKKSPAGVLVSVNHRLAGRQSVSIKEVAGEPFVFLAPETGVYQHDIDFCRAHGVEPKILATRTREASLVDFVEQDRAVALFRQVSVRLFPNRNVVYIPLVEELYMDVGLVRVRNKPLSPQATALWNFAEKRRKARENKNTAQP